MPGVWIFIIGLLAAFLGFFLKNQADRARLSTAFICIGVLMMIAGALLFILVAADVIRFPLV